MKRLLLVALPLLVCGTSLSAQTNPASSTLDKVKSSGAITVAYRDSSIPFSYLGANGQPTGFGWEICGRIVDDVKKAVGRTDLTTKTQAITAQNRIPLLQNGTIDIECGSTTNNADRNKQVAFATNYFYTGTRLLVKAGSPIKSLQDLKSRKVVSTTGTTNMLVIRKASKDQNLDLDLIAAKDHAESALLVETGRADAFAMDDILLYGIRANAINPAALAVVGESLQVEPYAIMVRKDDPAFKALVDSTIATLIKSGEFEKLYAKWFQSPIPPRGINLNAPMNRFEFEKLYAKWFQSPIPPRGINLNAPMSPELRANLKALSDKPAQ